MTVATKGAAGSGSSAYRIRPGRPEDAAALAEVFHAAVHGLASRHYTPVQIRAWCPERPPTEVFGRRLSDGRQLWVAADAEDVPAAFIDLEADGHVDMLFCHPRAAGQGVAAALYADLEAAARRDGLTRLHVRASEAARGFFERQGFAVQQRCLFERNGVMMHNYLMEKPLS
ncbi:GNAT family N-acetyltransferase [Nocardioides marinus]|nr:GNAT family N-acetyltransferase [Nocardioides marinus]